MDVGKEINARRWKEGRTHLRIPDALVLSDAIQGVEDVGQEALQARRLKVRGHGGEPLEN